MAPVIEFKPAIRRQLWVRIALSGPAGSGKSETGLLICKGLARQGETIAAIDTENERLLAYADVVDFLFGSLRPPYTPDRYLEACKLAIKAGAKVLLIDSLSHEWVGTGGILQIVDEATQASNKKDSFGSGWKKGSPIHNKFVTDLLDLPVHLVCTMRSKMEYSLEGGRISKIGLSPIQREETPYEFDLHLMQDMNHAVTVDKIRGKRQAYATGDVVPGDQVEELGSKIREWADGGEPAPARNRPAPVQAPRPARQQQQAPPARQQQQARPAAAPAQQSLAPEAEPSKNGNTVEALWVKFGQQHGWKPGIMLRRIHEEFPEVTTLHDLNPDSPAGKRLTEVVLAASQQ